jgi:hypothetical protein
MNPVLHPLSPPPFLWPQHPDAPVLLCMYQSGAHTSPYGSGPCAHAALRPETPIACSGSAPLPYTCCHLPTPSAPTRLCFCVCWRTTRAPTPHRMAWALAPSAALRAERATPVQHTAPCSTRGGGVNTCPQNQLSYQLCFCFALHSIQVQVAQV